MADYKVKFEVFEGPLDLLLYLIRKEEVDIYAVNLTQLATQFIEYIEVMASIKLDRVTRTFGTKTAVSNISFEVPDREFLVLLGPSGCGKSTLLRMNSVVTKELKVCGAFRTGVEFGWAVDLISNRRVDMS